MKKLKLMLAIGLMLLAVGAQARIINLNEVDPTTSHIGLQKNDTLTGSWAKNPVALIMQETGHIYLENVDMRGINDLKYNFPGLDLSGAYVYLHIKGQNHIEGNFTGTAAIRVRGGVNFRIIEDPEGGSLEAIGADHAAGIGSDRSLEGKTGPEITIDGGTIYAQGFDEYAGIGGGLDNNYTNISINGGIITAYGGSNAAAIGGGENGMYTQVFISPNVAMVQAFGGKNASCSIGHGKNGHSDAVAVNGVTYGNSGVIGNFELENRVVYTAFTEEDGVLTYYFDNQMAKRAAAGAIVEEYDPTKVRFKDYCKKVLKGVIDPSVKDKEFTTLERFFTGSQPGDLANLANMNEITGLEYLNTSKVTSMERMFYECNSWTGPADLTSWDLSSLNKVAYMFFFCQKLKTIYCNETLPSMYSEYMFNGCSVLVGGKGTVYTTAHQDRVYARPDGGPESTTPGYFTSPKEACDNLKAQLQADRDKLDAMKSFLVNWFSPAFYEDIMKDLNSYIETIDASLAMPGLTLAEQKMLYDDVMLADVNVESAINAYINLQITRVRTGLEYVASDNGCESDECKAIVTKYAEKAEKMLPKEWNYAETIKNNMDLVNNEATDYYDDGKEELLAQVIVNLKAELNYVISEMQELKSFAHNFLDNDDDLMDALKTAIENAKDAKDAAISISDFEKAITDANNALNAAIAALMTQAKSEINQELDDLLKEGDSYECQAIINDAKAAINDLKWDDKKDVKTNTEWLSSECYSIFSNASSALDARREKEASSVAVCDFTKPLGDNTNNQFTTTWTHDNAWTVFGGSNYNGTWNVCRMGGKKNNLAKANPVFIANQKPFDKAIKEIVVTITENSLAFPNMDVIEWGVNVYSAPEAFDGENWLYTVKGGEIPRKTATSLSLKSDAGKSWLPGYGYQVYWNLKNEGSDSEDRNGIIYVSKIEFFVDKFPTAIDQMSGIDAQVSTEKVLRNGQLYILRNGQTFTVTGQVVE